VHGGYTQADVMEAARCLTGFIVKEEWAPGQVELVAERHDDGDKRVLGETIASGGGAADIERLLDIVAAHPSTATHVAHKLVATFVDDEPPLEAVEHAAATFRSTNGDIRAVVKSVLGWSGFDAHTRSKIKRPFRFVASALRALGADTHAKGELVAWLARMGHAPYAWPTPDGCRSGETWLSTLMLRFRFASPWPRPHRSHSHRCRPLALRSGATSRSNASLHTRSGAACAHKNVNCSPRAPARTCAGAEALLPEVLMPAALVVIFLRGGADGLALVPPYADPILAELRPTIASALPDDTRVAAPDRVVDIDGRFGLHPALAPLSPLIGAGELAIVHATGSDDDTRSHFEAQDRMERAGITASSSAGLPRPPPREPAWARRRSAGGALVRGHLAGERARAQRHCARQPARARG
jgi:hypothetical protein